MKKLTGNHLRWVSILILILFNSGCWIFKKYSDDFEVDCDLVDDHVVKYWKDEATQFNRTEDVADFSREYSREAKLEISGDLDLSLAKAALSASETITVTHTVSVRFRVGKKLLVRTAIQGKRYNCTAIRKHPTAEQLNERPIRFSAFEPYGLIGDYTTEDI